MIFLAADAGVITVNGTVIVELVAFLAMLAILARYVYPYIVESAEARQRLIADQLRDAEKSRADAEASLKEAEARLIEARKTAQTMIEAATKSGEQLRQELKQKAEEEAKRMTESARKEIEADRERAMQSVRNEVAGMVVSATEKVIGETLDARKHKELIERAIEEVSNGRA